MTKNDTICKMTKNDKNIIILFAKKKVYLLTTGKINIVNLTAKKDCPKKL